MTRDALWRALRVTIACAIVGCGASAHDPEQRDSGAAEPDDLDGCAVRTDGCEAPDAVDLLFVIQDSSNARDYQFELAGAIRELLEPILARDIDLQVGVISTSYAPIPSVLGCNDEHADDGILRTRGEPSGTCELEPFARFSGGIADLDVAAEDAACRLVLGNGGCILPQSLEAMLKALATASSGITFAGGALGHGDRENAGFLRSGSVLAVVFLMTTRDDCSAADPSAAFDPSASPCGAACCEETLLPLSRYVEGLRQIRAETPGRIVVAPMIGIPWDVPPEPPSDFDAILMDPRMAEDILWCGGTSVNRPAERMVRFAQAFGDCGYVQPVCRLFRFGPEPEPMLRSIGDLIAARACTTATP